MNNQTVEAWLQNVAPNDPGTGVFVFPSQLAATFGPTTWTTALAREGFGPLMKALVADVDYLECARRGAPEWVVAFKWVPHSVADFNAVHASAGKCGAVLCVKRCAGYGCVCVHGGCA